MSHVSFQTRVHVVSVLKQGSLVDLRLRVKIILPLNQMLSFSIIISILHHVKSMSDIFPPKKKE